MADNLQMYGPPSPELPTPSNGMDLKAVDFEAGYITTDVDENADFRPFSKGMQSINTGVATIVLVQNDIPSSSKNSSTVGGGSALNASSLASKQIPVLTDIGNKFIGVFKNFSLTQYGENRQEAINIQRTFGREWVAFLFGENPRVYNFSGHFLDYEDYPHYEQFIKAYDLYLRGTKCLENKMSLYISYDGRLVRGLMTSITTNKVSGPGVPTGMVGFNFTLLVMGDQWIRNSYAQMTNYDVLSKLISKNVNINQNSFQGPV